MPDETTETEVPETETVETAETESEVEEDLSIEDLQARISELEQQSEKYKALMRKWETRAKESKARLEQKDDKSALEQAIAEAEARGRQSALTDSAKEKAELLASVLRTVADVPEDVLALIDPSKLLGEGGVNTEALAALVSSGKPRLGRSASELGLGPQGGGAAPSEEMDPAALAAMIHKVSPFA